MNLDTATPLQRGIYNMCLELEHLPASAFQTRLVTLLSDANAALAQQAERIMEREVESQRWRVELHGVRERLDINRAAADKAEAEVARLRGELEQAMSDAQVLADKLQGVGQLAVREQQRAEEAERVADNYRDVVLELQTEIRKLELAWSDVRRETLEEAERVSGMDLTQPSPYGPLFDIGWSSAVGNIRDAIRRLREAAEEGKP